MVPALYSASLDGCEVTTGEADAVVVGLDRDFHYDKLTKAADAVRAGAVLIGTNPDRMYPVPGGYIPGAGSVLAAVTAAAGLDAPHVIVGKPEPTLVEIARRKLGTAAERTIMVGNATTSRFPATTSRWTSSS